jgi:hypothetical protein
MGGLPRLRLFVENGSAQGILIEGVGSVQLTSSLGQLVLEKRQIMFSI